jgi:hypothetical protein
MQKAIAMGGIMLGMPQVTVLLLLLLQVTC